MCFYLLFTWTLSRLFILCCWFDLFGLFMLSIGEFFVEFIEHSTKYDENWCPLGIIHIMSIDKYTWNHSNNLSSCRNERENMLLKISNNIVDTNLTNYLKYTNNKNINQCSRILNHKLESRKNWSIYYKREEENDNKSIEIGGSKQLISCWLIWSFSICLTIRK